MGVGRGFPGLLRPAGYLGLALNLKIHLLGCWGSKDSDPHEVGKSDPALDPQPQLVKQARLQPAA